VVKTFRLRVAYDGTAYAGWQVQRNATTVQGVLEQAAERLNGEPTRIRGAGRTDAGVHARGQAARFQTPRALTAARVPHALNAFLPEDIVVVGADEVAPEFQPIAHAREKHYRYTLRVAAVPDPFDFRYVLRIEQPPDVDAMRAAAARLVGRHDFAAFEKSGSPRESTVRTLSRLDLVTQAEYIHIDLVANGFLYGMARNLAGTLLRVGQGTLSAQSVTPVERSCAGPCLAPSGLCLTRVVYDDDASRRDA
jgi:tRNA pseudouridine38-40 synthase